MLFENLRINWNQSSSGERYETFFYILLVLLTVSFIGLADSVQIKTENEASGEVGICFESDVPEISFSRVLRLLFEIFIAG